jgi:hypothetical protein
MKRINHALYIAITAMFSALLVGGKQALAVIPNVEVVTIVIALCSYVWGLGVALPAVFVFIGIEVAIFGINTWVISYIIHWNLLAVAFWLLSKVKVNNVINVVLATITAVVATVMFGVLTSAVDTCIGFVQGGGFFFDFDNFAKRFVTMYLAGVSFYVTQILCNLALFAIAFLPLAKLNQKAKLKMFGK